MKIYRALLLGTVGAGLVSYQASSRDLLPAQLATVFPADGTVTVPSMQLAEADEAAPAAEAAAPASSTNQGVTSYYGDGQTPDAGQPWAASAAMNADYTADASAPAAAESPTIETPAAESKAAEEAAPASTGGQGVTSYYGDGQTPDAGKPWAAPATVNADYTAQPAAAPAAGDKAIESCRDALNAEVHAGKLGFEISSWDISSDSFNTLDKIAKIAKDCGGAMIEVGGHTDNTGKPASNKTISEFRAQAVVKYLVREGVEASKLKAVGYGQDKPVGDNSTSEGRAQNRRIEFSVTAN